MRKFQKKIVYGLFIICTLFLVAFISLQLNWFFDPNQRSFYLKFESIELGNSLKEVEESVAKSDFYDSGEFLKKLPGCPETKKHLENQEFHYWYKGSVFSYEYFYVIGLFEKRVSYVCVAEANI